jgi:microcin C transport system permease protein
MMSDTAFDPAAASTPKAPPLSSGGTFRLTPINQRRWANFKANRRGYWSLWIFIGLFVLTLFAELLANDKPILLRFKGEWYVPILTDYAEETFLGEEAIPGMLAEFSRPEIMDVVNKDGWAIFPPIPFAPQTSVKLPLLPDLSKQMSAPTPPTWALSNAQCKEVAASYGGTDCSVVPTNWLGTDSATRDVLARVIYGLRISILFALLLTIASSLIGVAAGAIQGFYGGWVDLIFQRVIEVIESMPRLFLLIILASFFVPSFWTIFAVMLLFSWTALIGVVRAEFLRARNFDYVKAARAMGLKNSTIITRHVLPNAMVATITMVPFIIAGAVDSLTALDFLGLGMPPGTPSLGELAKQANDFPQAWWLGFSVFFTVSFLLTLLVFIGEAVRDAFDPRKTFG